MFWIAFGRELQFQSAECDSWGRGRECDVDGAGACCWSGGRNAERCIPWFAGSGFVRFRNRHDGIRGCDRQETAGDAGCGTCTGICNVASVGGVGGDGELRRIQYAIERGTADELRGDGYSLWHECAYAYAAVYVDCEAVGFGARPAVTLRDGMHAMLVPRVPPILPSKGFRARAALGFSRIRDPVQVAGSGEASLAL